jgi:hypothetical protein
MLSNSDPETSRPLGFTIAKVNRLMGVKIPRINKFAPFVILLERRKAKKIKLKFNTIEANRPPKSIKSGATTLNIRCANPIMA